MRTRLLYVLFFLWSPVNSAFSQSVISGKISDVSNNALQGMSVTLHLHKDTTIIAFGITNKDGRFSINFKSDQDSILIRAYGLGWAMQEKRLFNRSQEVNINLVSQPITLKEVKVKPFPITKLGDTLSYSVDAFKNQSDRVIADVIRKLPGLEMENDGRILYQGKPINKYYIEGMDLLESKYRLANDNLPADAVLQVQVIENHQPIRILDSIVFSNQAALNIRLKNNITVTGTAHMGIGGVPFLWDANLTPMLFKRNSQLITSWQFNNTGNNVSRQLKNISPGTVFNPLDNNEKEINWVTIQPLTTPTFDQTHWLNNNIHLGTVNYLRKIAKDVEIRLNISYIEDYQQQRGSTRTKYYIPGDTIDLTESKYNQLYFNSLETRITLRKNNSKKYFNNELSVKGNWDNQKGLILLDGVPLKQDLSNPFFWITNKFSDILKIGEQLVTFQSNTAADRAPQSLAVTPGQYADLINYGDDYEQTTQNVLATSFVTDNSISLTKKIKNFTLLPNIGIEIEKQKLRSSICYSEEGKSRTLTGDFANQLDWFKLNAYLKLKTQYQKDAWRLELDSPLNYYQFAVRDSLANKGQRLERFVLQPRFNANYNVSSYWSVNSSVNYRNRFGEIDDIYYGYILKTYRILQRKDVPLENIKLVSGTIGLNYRNPLRSVFGSFLYSYSISRNNILYRSRITAAGALEYSATAQTNNSYMRLMSGQISKYFLFIKTNISSNLSWLTTANNQLVNNSLTTIVNESINPRLTISTNFNKTLDIEYAYRSSLYIARLSESNKRNTFQQNHLLKFNLYPNRKSYLSIENEYYVNNLTTRTTRNLFTNILFRYAIPKKKVDLETRWSNIWNTSSLTNSSFNSFSYIESIFELRPMQIVQKIRFSF